MPQRVDAALTPQAIYEEVRVLEATMWVTLCDLHLGRAPEAAPTTTTCLDSDR